LSPLPTGDRVDAGPCGDPKLSDAIERHAGIESWIQASPDLDHIFDPKPGPQWRVLRDVPDPIQPLLWGCSNDLDRSGTGRQQPGRHVQQCRLARPVRTNERDHPAGWHLDGALA
jgi:hypothetical protein